jgi:hypothetical protein
MTAFNNHWMQSALTGFGFGPLSFWELLPLLGACALVALAVAACVPGRRRLVNPRNFSRLLDLVYHRREQLYSRPSARAWRSAARERFLESVRDRVRACGLFHRDSNQPDSDR